MKRIVLSMLVVSTVSLLSACGVAEGELSDSQNSGDVSATGDELGAGARTYVAVRRDLRKCSYPKCGGYYVHDVNRATLSEKYVRALDFTASGLTDADAQKALSAGDGELMLYGKLGPVASDGTRAFLVSEAYRGMPGVTPLSTDSFYKAAARDPQINCIAAPCDNEKATLLNHSSTTTYFTSYSVESAAKPFVDQSWLSSRVQQRGAIVAAHFANGQKFSGGYEKVLSASQVYVRLPENVGPCIMMPLAPCQSGTAVYSRTPDRCVMQSACVTPGVCPMFMPACEDGYTLNSWRSGTSACNKYVCDPTFITQ